MRPSQFLFGILAAAAIATTASAAEISASETMSCKLTNTDKDVALYDGACEVSEKITETSTIYSVKMGSSEEFLFASSDGKHWMHGPEEVEFRDLGAGAIFKWGGFALAVAE